VTVDVVVTGLGATTPLGGDVASTWAGLLAGRSGARPVEADWAADLPVRFASQLAVEPTEVLERVEARKLDRCEQVALVAAREAWADAGRPDVAPERLGVVVGTGIGGALTLLGQDDVLEQKGPRRVAPLTVPMLMPNGPAAWIGLDVKAKAFVRAPVSACATGADALSLALDQIRLGRADVVLAGGTEACIHPLPLAGFAQMQAMSKRNDDPAAASRPFDKGRDGFVLGEGAGVLVLERGDLARARGAKIYATFAGSGITADGHHIAIPDPSGAGVAAAVRQALADADLAAEEVGHVNAHATSTPVGDLAEAIALRQTLHRDLVVTAPKGGLGHLLGAAGAVEAIATVLALREGVVPPTRNLDDPDDEVDLDVVRNEPRKVELTAALNNSFGFGGHNVVLAFRAA
jgi:3-oxoacyl-[acyl-carrier-protein] synthase II